MITFQIIIGKAVAESALVYQWLTSNKIGDNDYVWFYMT